VDLRLGYCGLLIERLVKLLLSQFCRGVDLDLVFNYASAHPHEVGGFPCEDITDLVQE
jgi:hypothetical protein